MTLPPLREALKRALPNTVRQMLIGIRDRLGPPPLEDVVLHDYEFVEDAQARPRLSLVIPTIAPAAAFGGVTTGLNIFLEIGKRTQADLRILLDDFVRTIDMTVVSKSARDVGLDPTQIEIVPRGASIPRVEVRANDLFVSYNWWTTLNIQSLLNEQHRRFGGARKPFLYLIQEYEPLFYRMSSTHMMARAAFGTNSPCWGLFNSSELHSFFQAQGHSVERAFVFEPKLSERMRPQLGGEAPVKVKRILVYGRPSAPRNCFPAIEKGLRRWALRYPEFADWEVVSAGLPHPPLPFGPNRTLKSLGKLPIEDYASMLRTSAVGLSLMASPHPSYPPLEMAHFGLRTVTNSYTNKLLSTSHPNIISVPDIAPDTIADALGLACRAFKEDPCAGWLAHSNRPSFLEPGSFAFLDEISGILLEQVWQRRQPALATF